MMLTMAGKMLQTIGVLLVVISCAAQAQETTRTLTMDAAREKYAAKNSHFVDLEGVNVHYRDEGKGPAILLVHGTLGDAADWDGWAETLKKNYRVIRFDLPGFGISGDMKNGNYSVDRSLSLIDALMDHLGEEKFAIVGISYGGIVTFRYAATRTDRITAMVLVNSAGIQFGKRAIVKTDSDKTGNDKPVKPKPFKNIFIESVVLQEDVEAFYQGYINDPEARTPEFIQRKLDFLNIVGRAEIGMKGNALYERGNPKRVLSHVKAPSLVLWGQGNQALDTSTAEAFIEYLDNSCYTDIEFFDGGGHYINVERPEETVNAANKFFKKVLRKDFKECKPCSK